MNRFGGNGGNRRPFNRDGFRGGNRGGGFRRDFGPREMHKAICAECKRECEVPFKPREDRPVYCRDCFMKRKDSGSTGSFNREKPFKKNEDTESEDSESSDSEEDSEDEDSEEESEEKQ